VLDQSGAEEVDGMVFDLGVSSMQLDTAERGFSFRADGPLDMRMGGDGPTVADVVAVLSADELQSIFSVYGEERRARRAAEAIVAARKDAPIETTGRLAAVIEGAVGPGDGRIHPATRVFQALRIYVNDELHEVEHALYAAEARLVPGGRLAVVSFHSLEDRIVKLFLRERCGRAAQASRHAPMVVETREASFHPLHSGPVTPSDAEVEENPRARSAKLRAAVRTDAPAWPRAAPLAPQPDARPLEEIRR
jgi:16S rRNA (cytosine1402-N4)-methyltransferase